MAQRQEPLIAVELRDDFVYEIECMQGHRTVVALQNPKFEILFELGVMALLDGYPREALSSMAAAVERFHEFHVEAICIHREIPYDTHEKAWETSTRALSTMSR